MSGIKYKSQINMPVPPTEDDHVARLAEIKQTMRQGVPGAYTQGVDFTNFQEFLDEHMSNHFFTTGMTINLTEPVTGNIAIRNVRGTGNFIIVSNERIAATLSLFDIGVGITLRSYAETALTTLAATGVRNLSLQGKTKYPTVSITQVGWCIVGNQQGAGDEIAVDTFVVEGGSLMTPSVQAASIDIGTLTNRGTVSIPATITTLKVGTYSGYGVALDSREEHPLEIYARTDNMAMKRGKAGEYVQGEDFTDLKTFVDEHINNHVFDGGVSIRTTETSAENITFANIINTNIEDLELRIEYNETVANTLVFFNVTGFGVNLIGDSSISLCGSLGLFNVLEARFERGVLVNQIDMMETKLQLSGFGGVHNINRINIESGIVSIDGEQYPINIEQLYGTGMVIIAPHTSQLTINEIEWKTLVIDERPGRPQETFLCAGGDVPWKKGVGGYHYQQGSDFTDLDIFLIENINNHVFDSPVSISVTQSNMNAEINFKNVIVNPLLRNAEPAISINHNGRIGYTLSISNVVGGAVVLNNNNPDEAICADLEFRDVNKVEFEGYVNTPTIQAENTHVEVTDRTSGSPRVPSITMRNSRFTVNTQQGVPFSIDEVAGSGTLNIGQYVDKDVYFPISEGVLAIDNRPNRPQESFASGTDILYKRGEPGEYTQGSDFDNGAIDFQTWFNENVKNRFFDDNLTIRFTSPPSTTVYIDSVYMSSLSNLIAVLTIDVDMPDGTPTGQGRAFSLRDITGMVKLSGRNWVGFASSGNVRFVDRVDFRGREITTDTYEKLSFGMSSISIWDTNVNFATGALVVNCSFVYPIDRRATNTVESLIGRSPRGARFEGNTYLP